MQNSERQWTKSRGTDGKIDFYLITYEQNKVGNKYGGDGVSDPRPHNPVADQQAGQQEKQVLRVHILYRNHQVYRKSVNDALEIVEIYYLFFFRKTVDFRIPTIGSRRWLIEAVRNGMLPDGLTNLNKNVIFLNRKTVCSI